MKIAILVVCAILLSAPLAFPQAGQRSVYEVSAFSGLNLAGDSVDIDPKEAVSLINFSLDKFGSLHKRYGYSQWDSMLMAVGEHIQDIEYVEQRNSKKSIFFATNKFVYEQRGWEDTNTVWIDNRISYSRGHLDTMIFSGTPINQLHVYGDSTEWLMAASIGDSIEFNGLRFEIADIYNDTCLRLLPLISMPDTTYYNYKILKYSHGVISLSSYNGSLFAADAKAPAWLYDSSGVRLLSVIDTGHVDTNFYVADTIRPYMFDPLMATIKSDSVALVGDIIQYFDSTYNDGSAVDSLGTSVVMWLGIHMQIHYTNGADSNFYGEFGYNGGVVGVEGTSKTLILDTPFNTQHMFNDQNENPPVQQNQHNWIFGLNDRHGGNNNIIWLYRSTFVNEWMWVDSILFYSPYSGKIMRGENKIYDSHKDFISNNYNGFYIINANDASLASHVTGHLDLHTLVCDSMAHFNTGDRYYILSNLPSIYRVFYRDFVDSVRVDRRYYSQILFRNKQLVAIGREYIETGLFQYFWNYTVNADTVYRDRVWFSETGRPNFIKDNMNFDLSGGNSSINQSIISGDASQSEFQIGNNLYVVTKQAIYRISGSLSFDPNDILQIVNQRIVDNFGVLGTHSTVVYPDNIAYMMNNDGIWSFDGQNIQAVSYFSGGSPSQKISYKTRDLTEQYRGSNKVVGYFKDEIYFSYSDSHVTLTMFNPTKAFTTWDMGMDAINTQSVAIDSNYFLFAPNLDSTIVCRYPASIDSSGNRFYDRYLNHSVAFPIQYYSGWQSFNRNDFDEKQLEQVELVGKQNGGSVSWRVYVDHDSLPADSLNFPEGNWYKSRFLFNNNCQGDFFQFRLDAITSNDLVFNSYRLKIYNTHR